MAYVRVDVDVNEILYEIATDDLVQELRKRAKFRDRSFDPIALFRETKRDKDPDVVGNLLRDLMQEYDRFGVDGLLWMIRRESDHIKFKEEPIEVRFAEFEKSRAIA